MLPADQVKAQLAQLGITGISSKQEGYKALSEVLRINERIEAAVAGSYEGLYGAAAATDQRIVFVGRKPGPLGKLCSEDFQYSVISSVQIKQGAVFGTVEVYTSGHKAEIDKVPKVDAMKFADHLKQRVASAKIPTTTHVAQIDVATQLEKLVNLRSQGILTDEEFNIQKQKLLNL